MDDCSCILLLLLSICAAIQFASSEKFFVIAKPNDSCPGKFTGEPCLTMMQFVSGSYTRFLSDPNLVSEITLDLQPGLHQITNFYDFQVQYIARFTLKADSGAILDCGNGHFNITNVNDIQISGIQFINCNKFIVVQSATQLIFDNCSLNQDESLWIMDTTKAKLMNSSFRDSKLTVYVRRSSVAINQCTFTDNCIGVFGEESYITIDQGIFNRNRANCVLESNHLVHSGGALHLEFNAYPKQVFWQNQPLTIINSTFNNNIAHENGGAIYLSGLNIEINGSMFINNTARLQGGAVYIASTRTSSGSTSRIYDSKFIANHASIGGGAIYAPASIQIGRSAFIENSARSRGGGAIYTGGYHSDIDVIDSVFKNNSAAYCGVFDIDELHHRVKLLRSTFSMNVATGQSDISHILSFSGIKSDIGGVICVRNASVVILDSNFTNNLAVGYGGVMYVDDSKITVEKSTFDGNVGGRSGGVLYSELHRIQLKVTFSSFTNNHAQNGDGGVLYIGRAHSRVNISDSKFDFNTATDRGGVFVMYGGVLELNSTNVYNNGAELGGAIGSTCNSEITVSDDLEIIISTDPEFSLCTLYEEYERDYDQLMSTSPVTTTTPHPMYYTTDKYEASAATSTNTATIGTSEMTASIDEKTDQTMESFSTATHGSVVKTPTTAPPTTNSIPAVYFQLNSDVYLNNSMIPLQNVGEGDNALICVTNKQDCCGTPSNRMGEFLYPNGDQVPIRSHGDNFYRQRGEREIYLNRKFGITSPAGTYSCVIPDATGTIRTLYIQLQ